MNYKLWDKQESINGLPPSHFLSKEIFKDYTGDIILIYSDNGKVSNIECKDILAEVYGISKTLPLDNFMSAYFAKLEELNQKNEGATVVGQDETIELNGEYDGTSVEVDNLEINLKTYLNSKKLPLKVNVNKDYIKPAGTKNIIENGTHNIRTYENVNVNVPIPNNYIDPTGTKDITTNGSHNIREYNSVNVQVPIPEGYIKPSGTLDITESGLYNVKEYENVNVSSGGSTLKTLLDNTKTCENLFKSYSGANVSELIKYNDTENVTNFSSMFNYCRNATSFPLINTSNGTNFNSMYSGCSSATSFPQLDTSKGTTFNSMFTNCSSATSFPLIDTSQATDLSRMYNNCSSATSFPPLNTPKVTNVSTMYYGCSSATSFPQLNTSKCSSFLSMFANCSSATSFPQLDTSKGTTFNSMFTNCSSATSFPQLDTSKGTSFSYTFGDCHRVKKIDISKYTVYQTSNATGTFSNCHSLKVLVIRSFGTGYVLNTNTFTNCYRILGTTDATYNPNGDQDGYIYVPRDMIETLSSATNWSAFATQFRALEDYTKDGTTTGEFDDEKAGI